MKFWGESVSQLLSKTIIKLMMSSLVRCNCHSVLGVKVQLFFIFRGIKVKFGGGVNSEVLISLISYFMSVLPYK